MLKISELDYKQVKVIALLFIKLVKIYRNSISKGTS